MSPGGSRSDGWLNTFESHPTSVRVTAWAPALPAQGAREPNAGGSLGDGNSLTVENRRASTGFRQEMRTATMPARKHRPSLRQPAG